MKLNDVSGTYVSGGGVWCVSKGEDERMYVELNGCRLYYNSPSAWEKDYRALVKLVHGSTARRVKKK